MDLLNLSGMEDVLHALSQGLIVPTVVCLLLFAAFSVYTIGSVVVEYAVERRHYRAEIPRLIARLDEASCGELPDVIEESELLDTHKESLLTLVSYLYLPEDALVEVAKRLLGDERERCERALSWTDLAVKVAPMLGLMGTLIPLGPGIVGLSSGDLETLSSSLLVAFDTTVAGLAVAVVCLFVSKIRRRWYATYLANVEGLMNTILEKAAILREQGYVFAGAVEPSSIDEMGGETW